LHNCENSGGSAAPTRTNPEIKAIFLDFHSLVFQRV
jgi:hypothetical protein